MPTLAERFDPRDNAMGLLRLVLAEMVLIAHAWPLGFGWPGLGPLGLATHAQVNALTVYGFFIISGYLITSSGLRSGTIGRFAWNRFLRIFPGFWACLLLTALVIAPLVAWWERGSLAGFWDSPTGPLRHVWLNWFTAMDEFGISGLLADTTPYGRISGGSVFNGSLWSLKYELACYVVVGVLAVAGALRRAPRTVLAFTGLWYLFITVAFFVTVSEVPRPEFPGAVGPLPLIGSFNVNQTVYLGFLFLLGSCIRLYRHRVPMHGALAAVALVVLVLSLTVSGFVVVGLPAYAYLLFYVAVAAPRRLRAVGRNRDYSYGIYLYSFPVQQTLALVGAARFGLLGFIVLSTLGTGALAVLSWHLVERPALRFKRRTRTPSPPALAPTAPEQSGAERPGLEQSGAERPGPEPAAPAPAGRH